MKTKLIGYGIVLATCLVEAEPKDGEAVAQPSEAARFIAEVFRIIELQAETIRNMSIIIRNGERIAMEILERCGQNFVPTQGYDPELNEIENQNITFLKSHRNFPFVQYEPSTSEQDVETKSEVKNLSSSLDIWNQCLSGVGEKEKQSKEAIAREREKTSKAEESLKAAQAKALEVEEKNKQLAIEKQRAEQLASDLQKAKESGSAEVQRLNTQLKEAQSKVQTITKEMTVVKANSVDRAKVIEELRRSVDSSGQNENLKNRIKAFLK